MFGESLFCDPFRNWGIHFLKFTILNMLICSLAPGFFRGVLPKKSLETSRWGCWRSSEDDLLTTCCLPLQQLGPVRIVICNLHFSTPPLGAWVRFQCKWLTLGVRITIWLTMPLLWTFPPQVLIDVIHFVKFCNCMCTIEWENKENCK